MRLHRSETEQRVAALVLAGGASSRMGTEKALLRLPDGRSALAAVIDAAHGATTAIYLAAGSAEQGERLLAALAAPRPKLLIDDQPGEGPLAALTVALRQVMADGMLLLPVDAPLLQADFARLLGDRFASANADAVLPEADGWVRPLPAVYGRAVLPCAERLLAAGRRDLRALAECRDLSVLAVPEAELRRVDPELLSLRGANTPAEWQALLALARGAIGTPWAIPRGRLAVSGYRLLDHTADVGVEAWGATPAEAFVAAARGLFAVVLDQDPEEWQGEGADATIAIDCEARSWPGLLVAWLSELLYRFDAEAFLPRAFDLTESAPPRLTATLHGLTLADPAQAAGTAVKAVTYHHLRVDVGNGETRINVVLDI